MGNRGIERVGLALRRPDLAWRRLTRRSVIEIGLDEIAPYVGTRPVILEAGALNGDDTVRFAEQWPDAEIYVFEPVPAAFEQVVARTAELPAVRRYQVALGASSGSQQMFVSSAADGNYRPDSSSLLEPSGHLTEFPGVTFASTVEVPVLTLADWASSEGVELLDLMWLDLQGMELAVLQASPQVLAVTRAVCLEVARKEMYRDGPLYDEIVDWMCTQGFEPVIDRVPVLFGNMLFVNRNR